MCNVRPPTLIWDTLLESYWFSLGMKTAIIYLGQDPEYKDLPMVELSYIRRLLSPRH